MLDIAWPRRAFMQHCQSMVAQRQASGDLEVEGAKALKLDRLDGQHRDRRTGVVIQGVLQVLLQPRVVRLALGSVDQDRVRLPRRFAGPSQLMHVADTHMADTHGERAQSWAAEQGACLRGGADLVQQDARVVPLVFAKEVGVAVLCELPVGGLDGLRGCVVVDLCVCTAQLLCDRGVSCRAGAARSPCDRSSAAGRAGVPPEARSSR